MLLHSRSFPCLEHSDFGYFTSLILFLFLKTRIAPFTLTDQQCSKWVIPVLRLHLLYKWTGAFNSLVSTLKIWFHRPGKVIVLSNYTSDSRTFTQNKHGSLCSPVFLHNVADGLVIVSDRFLYSLGRSSYYVLPLCTWLDTAKWICALVKVETVRHELPTGTDRTGLVLTVFGGLGGALRPLVERPGPSC